MKKLTENTLVPLSLVMVILSCAVGFGMMNEKVDAHERRLERVERTEDAFTRDVIDRLARIETTVNVIKRSQKKGE